MAVIGMYSMATTVYAQTMAQSSATKAAGTMNAFLGLLPIAARIGGVVAIIGGLWSFYKHFKSQGRDGSIPAGFAGLGVGVALFFLGGTLRFGADSLGVDQSAMPT